MSSHHSSSRQSTAQRQPSSSRTVPSIAVMGTGTPARDGHSASSYGEYLEVPSSYRPSTSASHYSSTSGSRSASASSQRNGMLNVPHGRSSSGTRSGSVSHHSSSRSISAGAGMLQVPQAQPGRSSSASRSTFASHHSFGSRTITGARSGDLYDLPSSSYHPSRTADHCSPSSSDAMVLHPQTPSHTASSSTRPASTRLSSRYLDTVPVSRQPPFGVAPPRSSSTTRQVMMYEHTSVRYYTEHST